MPSFAPNSSTVIPRFGDRPERPSPATAHTIPNFADAREWITVPDVKLIDAHTLTTPDGRPQMAIDEEFLQDVARNGNARIARTGDAIPGIIGHTTDSPNDPEKPVRCWFTGLKVRPGPDGKPTLFANQHVKKKFANILEDYPRRSVELWIGKREIDPVALLGGTTPERDLGITKYHRDDGDNPVIRFSRRAGDYCYHYSPESVMPFSAQPNGYPSLLTANGRPVRYFADDGKDTDDAPVGGPPGDGGDDGSGEDPMIAKLVNSSAFKDAIRAIVEDAINEAMGEDGGDEMGGAPPGMGGPPEMGGAPGGAPPMPPGAGAPPMGGMPPGGPPAGGPEDEAQRYHEAPPVRFNDLGGGGGYPSGTNGFIPDEGGPLRRAANCETPMTYSRSGVASDDPYQLYLAAQAARRSGRPISAAAAPPTAHQPTVQRLSRVEQENQQLKLRLARADAAEFVRQLQDTGIVVDDPTYLAETLANFEFVPNGIKARNEFIEKVVKKNFARREQDPTSTVDLMRFSRSPAAAQTVAKGPSTPEETQQLVRYARANGMTGDMAAAWAKMNGAAK